MSAKIPLKPINFDAAQRAVDEMVVERLVPVHVVPAPAPASPEGEGGDAPQLVTASVAPARPVRSPTRNFSVNLPEYVIDAIFARAAQSKPRGTVRGVILQALRATGIDIKDIDMIPDNRRTRVA